MEHKNNNGQWLIAILIFFLILVFMRKDTYQGLTAEEWFSEYDYQQEINAELEDKLVDYQDALQDANNNIEEAKWYAWETYDDMGYALDDLETVSDPWY